MSALGYTEGGGLPPYGMQLGRIHDNTAMATIILTFSLSGNKGAHTSALPSPFSYPHYRISHSIRQLRMHHIHRHSMNRINQRNLCPRFAGADSSPLLRHCRAVCRSIYLDQSLG
jgi:hypothetical protein